MKPSALALLLFVSVIIIGLGACNDSVLSPADSDTEQPNDSIPDQTEDTLSIMPLAVGNRWIQREEDLDESGNLVRTSYDTVEVVDRHQVNGEWWYEIVESGITRFYTNRNDGLWLRDSLTSSNMVFLVKYPAAVGDVDIMDTSVTPLVKDLPLVYTSTVVSTNASASVPAGSYQGIRYRYDLYNVDGSIFIEETSYATYAPGVGPIRIESYGLYGQPKYRTPYITKRWDLIEVVLY